MSRGGALIFFYFLFLFWLFFLFLINSVKAKTVFFPMLTWCFHICWTDTKLHKAVWRCCYKRSTLVLVAVGIGDTDTFKQRMITCFTEISFLFPSFSQQSKTQQPAPTGRTKLSANVNISSLWVGPLINIGFFPPLIFFQHHNMKL